MIYSVLHKKNIEREQKNMGILSILFLIAFTIMEVYLLRCLVRYRKEEAKEERCDGIVRLPKQLRNYGIIFMLVGVAFGIFLYSVTQDINGLYLGMVFTMCGSFMLSGYLNFKIIYGEKSFTYSNNLGMKSQYNFADITRIAWGNTGAYDVVIYVGEKKVRIDEIAVGSEEFLKRAEQNFKSRYGKKDKVIKKKRSERR